MKITPIDIQQQQFLRKFRGYNREDVDAFLALVAAELESVIFENNDFKEQLKAAQERIAEFERKEKTLKDAILMAQKAADEIRSTVNKQAELIKAEAEMKAEQILEGAKFKVSSIESSLGDLRRQRAQFEAELRATLDYHNKLLNLPSSFDNDNAAAKANIVNMKKKSSKTSQA